MQGSLCLRAGVLYVARQAQAAFVRPYDFDGRPLSRGIRLVDEQGAPVAAGGIDVDSDRQVWVADTERGCVRVFNLFGIQTARFDGAVRARDDARGTLHGAVDVALSETDESRTLYVGSRGWRRHALQTFRSDGAVIDSLRPGGDPLGRFRDVQRIAVLGRFTYACEFGAARVQVFRDDEHLFTFRPLDERGAVAPPAALAPLADGRMLIATGAEDARLLLVDGSGRTVRELARTGREGFDIRHPGDVVAEFASDERSTRIALIDRDGERVQVFTLEGACHGEFSDLPGHAVGEAE